MGGADACGSGAACLDRHAAKWRLAMTSFVAAVWIATSRFASLALLAMTCDVGLALAIAWPKLGSPEQVCTRGELGVSLSMFSTAEGLNTA